MILREEGNWRVAARHYGIEITHKCSSFNDQYYHWAFPRGGKCSVCCEPIPTVIEAMYHVGNMR